VTRTGDDPHRSLLIRGDPLHIARSVLRAIGLIAATLVALLAVAGVAAAAPTDDPPLDPNDFGCIEGHICLFDGNGGPWSASLTIQEGEPGDATDLRDDNPDADRHDWVTSYTNETSRVVRFYDQPEGSECWDLLYEAEPGSQGLLPAEADDAADLVIQDAEQPNPCARRQS
jgi:hypothetical protein